jgi:hypothetical protein
VLASDCADRVPEGWPYPIGGSFPPIRGIADKSAIANQAECDP